MAGATFTVELKLSAPEHLGLGADMRPVPEPGGVAEGEWKAYPYGWVAPEGVSERVAAALALDAEDDLLEECRRFVHLQYERGDVPLAWRIMKGSRRIDGGTTKPPTPMVNN